MEQENRAGRPRSERARQAVLHAVDDLLVEQGYAAMTMKGIAERAGVGRQTVYRWWSTKAEILLEASVVDAREELVVATSGDPARVLAGFVRVLIRFLTVSPAGAAYRALIGEAQHDEDVARLLAGQDVLTESARTVLTAALPELAGSARRNRRQLEDATAVLVGPVLAWVLIGRDPDDLGPTRIARTVLATVAAGSAT